ncbi:MAG: flagellar brake protein [Alcaligenaceae bacterium]|jgi:c-di-GMP-binding flagellar brake protein YcgR|nr:flagellar brake protein [Alcaligenaceae bacterium]
MSENQSPMESIDDIDPADPYTLTAPLEIQSVLRNIKLSKSLVHVYVLGQDASAITTVLDVDSKENRLIVDSFNDPTVTQQVQRARKLVAQATLDRIHVKFVCPPLAPCEFEGKPALQAAMPAALSYLQRRDAYRIETPVVNPVMCTITLSEDTKTRKVRLPLADISIGGIGLYDEQQLPEHSIGTIYEDCQIVLPEVGNLTVALRIQHVTDQTLTNGKTRLRLGCAFVNPSNSAINMVQRYVGRLERELLAKKRGFV